MYPQHEKLKQNQAAHATISEFLEFCQSRDIELTQHEPDGTSAGRYHHFKPAALIAAFFGLDPAAFAREENQMLADWQRRAV